MILNGRKMYRLNFFFFFCVYKMYLISADFLRVRKADEIWVNMKNVHDRLGVKICLI